MVVRVNIHGFTGRKADNLTVFPSPSITICWSLPPSLSITIYWSLPLSLCQYNHLLINLFGLLYTKHFIIVLLGLFCVFIGFLDKSVEGSKPNMLCGEGRPELLGSQILGFFFMFQNSVWCDHPLLSWNFKQSWPLLKVTTSSITEFKVISLVSSDLVWFKLCIIVITPPPPPINHLLFFKIFAAKCTLSS